jgi:hypothetical protein
VGRCPDLGSTCRHSTRPWTPHDAPGETCRGADWPAPKRRQPSDDARLANGHRPEVDSFAALVRWLGMPAERFMIDDEVSDEAQPELLAEFAPLLRPS